MENYQERLELINKERRERRQIMEEYLQKQAQAPDSDTDHAGLFNFA